MANQLRVLKHHIAKEPMLWFSGTLLFVIGVALVYVSHSHWLGEISEVLAEVLRELGIAVCISVLIAALIEIGLTRKMGENALEAIMRKTVPENVWDSIRQYVITQPVLRYDWTISMSIKQEDGGGYVSTTTVSYKIKSLRDFLRYYIFHELDAPRLVDQQRPFEWIKIGGVEQKLAEIVKNCRAEFSIAFEEENELVPVSMCFKEHVHENDVINWWMNITTQKLTVDIHTPPFWIVEVQAHHPESNIVQPVKLQKSRWESAEKAVMLPGQGFEIRLSHDPQGAAIAQAGVTIR